MTIKIICRKDVKSKRTGMSPLNFLISIGDKSYKLPTGQETDGWDHKAQAVPGKFNNAAQTNQALRKATIALQDILDSQKPFNIESIRTIFGQYLNDPESFDLVNSITVIEQAAKSDDLAMLTRRWTKEDWKAYNKLSSNGKAFYIVIERIVQDHANDWSYGYLKRFRTIRTKILGFDPDFRPESITEKWYRNYCRHCIEVLNNVGNTINTDTKVLCAMIKELRKQGFVITVDTDKLSWRYTEPEVKGLSWDKVLKIAAMDLKDYPAETVNTGGRGTLEAARILWLIGAFTGRRWEEVLSMTRGNFYQKDGQWKYRNIGKGNKIVDIPVLPEAIELMQSIKFQVPQIANQLMNQHIKLICKIAKFNDPILKITVIDKNQNEKTTEPEFETVTYHTARHSFGQHIAELSAGKPHAEKFVSHMLGHSSFATTWKYLNRAGNSHDQMFNDIILKTTLKKVA